MITESETERIKLESSGRGHRGSREAIEYTSRAKIRSFGKAGSYVEGSARKINGCEYQNILLLEVDRTQFIPSTLVWESYPRSLSSWPILVVLSWLFLRPLW